MTSKLTPQRYFWIVLVAILVACSPLAPARTVTPSATSVASSTPTVLPTETPTPFPQQPPACTFPLAQTTIEESTPEKYTFSEPRVVLTANVEIVDWLPDSQRVLLVQNFGDTTKQNIDLFNFQTGKLEVYATREQTFEPPAWLPGLNAAVYPVMHVLKNENTNLRSGLVGQIWVSRGDPNRVQLLKDNLPYFSIAVKPGGGQVAYQTDKQLFKIGASLAAQTSVAFDPNRWDYRRSSNSLSLSFKATWRPGTSQIFFYTYGASIMGYTFLLDTDSGELCELNFDGWAFLGRWSSDGRYLAIVRNKEPGFPANSTDLAVLDTATGELYTMGVTSKETAGRHYVSGIAWAPDNHHLLTIGSVLSFPHCSPNCPEDIRLYLVDFLTGQVDPLLPTHQFIANNPGTNLAWSPDGSKVLALCSNKQEGGLCLISVQRTIQP